MSDFKRGHDMEDEADGKCEVRLYPYTYKVAWSFSDGPGAVRVWEEQGFNTLYEAQKYARGLVMDGGEGLVVMGFQMREVELDSLLDAESPDALRLAHRERW